MSKPILAAALTPAILTIALPGYFIGLVRLPISPLIGPDLEAVSKGWS